MTTHPNRSQSAATRAAELAALLARHYPDASPHAVAAVVRACQAATRQAHALAEDSCNRDLGDPDDSESEHCRRHARQSRAEARINATLARVRLQPADSAFAASISPEIDSDGFAPHALPAHVDLGGDPRGPCGRLHVPGQPGDS